VSSRQQRSETGNAARGRDNSQNPSYERILEAAKELFLTVGYPDTSMDGIARRADVVRATVYNNFADKEAILAELMRRYLAGYAVIPARLSEQARPEQSSFQLIESMIREAILWRLENAELRPLIDLAKHLPNSGWADANEVADAAMRQWILDLHKRDGADNEPHDGIDIEFAAHALYGMIDAVLSSFDVRTRRRDVEIAVRQLGLLHWHALYAGPPDLGEELQPGRGPARVRRSRRQA
jgi:AcrR family transcriptional regulator